MKRSVSEAGFHGENRPFLASKFFTIAVASADGQKGQRVTISFVKGCVGIEDIPRSLEAAESRSTGHECNVWPVRTDAPASNITATADRRREHHNVLPLNHTTLT